MTTLPNQTPFSILPLPSHGKNDLCDYTHERDYTGTNRRLFDAIRNGETKPVHEAIDHAFNAGRQAMFDCLIDDILECCRTIDVLAESNGEYDGHAEEAMARRIEFIRTGRAPTSSKRDWNKGPVPSDILKAHERFVLSLKKARGEA